MKWRLILIACLPGCVTANCQQIHFADTAEIFKPGLVSTKNADVKITFSPDGKTMLWGGIDWIPRKADMDIWQSTNINGQWSQPKPVSFNSDSNDFDPCFSPDGKGVYFFSNRAGGFGGDDIYFAPYNSADNSFSQPVNAGNQINTAGNEWAPVTNAAGTVLVFSSNGHGGFGGQDLFMSPILPGYSFGKAINLGNAVNGMGDDFDAVILPNNAIVFTSAKDTAAKADLYIACQKADGYTQAEKLPAQINGTGYWTFGPSVNPKQPGYLYFSGHLRNNMGRTDIYRIKYSVR